MPYARVIACQYQTDFAAFMKPNQSVMEDLAIGLLLSLQRIRSNLPFHVSVQVSSPVCTPLECHSCVIAMYQIRPLLFVAHSIGGTLIKQVGLLYGRHVTFGLISREALNISHLSPEQALHAISVATQGIVFLGTPHRNDRQFSIGLVTAMAVRAESLDLNNEVLDVIKRDPIFELSNIYFQEYLEKREHSVHVASFYEQRHLFPPVRCLGSWQCAFNKLLE